MNEKFYGSKYRPPWEANERIEALIKERDKLAAKLADSGRRALLDAAEKFSGDKPYVFKNRIWADGYANARDIASELRHMADQLQPPTPKNVIIEPGEAS